VPEPGAVSIFVVSGVFIRTMQLRREKPTKVICPAEFSGFCTQHQKF
jgi:hypothetical protein